MSLPVFDVDPYGRLADRMIQYLVALKFVDLAGGDCRISGVSLPAWGIDHPQFESPGPSVAFAREQHVALTSSPTRSVPGR